MMLSRKAQTSVETLVVLALALVVLASVVSISQQNIGSGQATLRQAQARQAVQSLATAADEVYAEGPGAKKRVYVTFPEGIQSITINGNLININIQTGDGVSDINAKSNALLVGSLSTTSRSEWVWVTANENGQVAIGAAGLSISPTTAYASLYPSNYSLQNFTITNLAASAAEITVTVTAPTNQVVGIALLNSTDLSSLGTTVTAPLSEYGGSDYARTFTLNVSSTADALGSYYDGYVTANTSTESVRMDVSIEVSSLPGGGTVDASNNVSSIVVSTFKEPGRTTPKLIFYQALNITLVGTGWTQSASLTLNLTFPNSTSLSGYPTTFAANSSGGYLRYFNATGLPSGAYQLITNQSGVTKTSTITLTC